MSRRARIFRNIAIGLVAAAIVIGVAVVLVLRTSRFQEWAKQKIVAAIAERTGGETSIGSFGLDVFRLQAHITNLVIHGSEPASAAPLVRIAQIDLTARLFGGGRILGISYLGVHKPEINIIVFPDGRTNLPTPKPAAPSKNSPLETVVDLAVGQFQLGNGSLTLNERQKPIEIEAHNLQVQLWYRPFQHDYTGRISLEPVYFVSGRNTPVTCQVTLPLVLDRDRIRLEGAAITTANSAVRIDASLEDLRQPLLSGHLSGQIALVDLDRATGLRLDTTRRGLPQTLHLDVNAAASANQVRVASLAVDFGLSHVQASGVLKGGSSGNALRFDGSLDLAQASRLARLSTRPEGSLVVRGDATLDRENRFRVSAHVFSRDLALRQGDLRVRSASLSTNVLVESDTVQLTGLHLDALGGEFAGDATLRDFARYQLAGSVRNLDLQALGALLRFSLPYSGTVSGRLQASGNLKAPDARSLDVQAGLAIAPGSHGIPLRGRVAGSYQGASGDVRVENSYLALPHTRLTVAGSSDRGLNVSLVTRDLRDLLAAVNAAQSSPVALAGGQAEFTGQITGPLAAPRIAGHLSATQFQVEGRRFTEFGADVSASPSGVSVANGALKRDQMAATFSGAVQLRAWKPGTREQIAADVNLQHGDLADVLAIAGESPQGYSGALTASVHLAGTFGNPAGSVAIHAANGSLDGQHFDRLDAQIGLTDRLAVIQSASVQAGSARIDLAGSFQHPRDSFTQGDIQASLRTIQVDLARIPAPPNTSGQLQISATIAGRLAPRAGATGSEFLLTSVQAKGWARAVRYRGQAYGDFQLTVETAGQTATTDLTSDFAGSNVRIHGTTRLVSGYPSSADAQIAGLPVERVLALAGRGEIPVRGKLSATAHLHGTPALPEGDATVDLTNAVVYGQPLDRVQAQASSTAQTLQLSHVEAVSGPSHVGLDARFDHPAGRMDAGTLQFRVEDGYLDLARLRAVENARPGLAGTVEIAADGSAAVAPGAPLFRLTGLNANIAAAHVAVQGKDLGGLTLAAHTATANHVEVTLNSDLAGAAIQASASGQLGGDYPLNAQLSFKNVKWTNLEKLLGTPSGEAPPFEIAAAGKAAVNGPILQPAALEGSLELQQLDWQTVPQTGTLRSIDIRNQGPVDASLSHEVVTLSSFHLTGPDTDIQAFGTVPLNHGSLNLTVNAGINLAVLENLSRDVDSSGKITLAAGVRGTLSSPLANGSLQLQNASVNYAKIPTGLSNANGAIEFQGNRASIQNLTAESGGGKVVVSGFAILGGNPRFALHASASNVHVRVQEGVFLSGNADLSAAGVPDNSTATGTVTLTQLNYAPQSDLGSILARAQPQVESPSVPNPLFNHMKLAIRVRTSVAMRVRTSLAENLQTDADLRLSGTAARPTILGRVNLDQGRLVFFGSTYTVNSGSITFANPVRIEPLLNLSLQTETKGVKVTLNVTGPIDNMKLTYTSDPPLQFQEIAALLSTGNVPTSDPTLLANQPAQPSQSFAQSGESAILGQAVANPVATRLQRVFGVSQLQIDPAFTGATALPTAGVTLQQRISTALTFTYTSVLNDPNATLIRAEWAVNQRWSATALRDQNGIVSVNLLYKKQFR